MRRLFGILFALLVVAIALGAAAGHQLLRPAREPGSALQTFTVATGAGLGRRRLAMAMTVFHTADRTKAAWTINSPAMKAVSGQRIAAKA